MASLSLAPQPARRQRSPGPHAASAQPSSRASYPPCSTICVVGLHAGHTHQCCWARSPACGLNSECSRILAPIGLTERLMTSDLPRRDSSDSATVGPPSILLPAHARHTGALFLLRKCALTPLGRRAHRINAAHGFRAQPARTSGRGLPGTQVHVVACSPDSMRGAARRLRGWAAPSHCEPRRPSKQKQVAARSEPPCGVRARLLRTEERSGLSEARLC
ncbi:hypothetical protein OBBRIDRAFT_787128 [Obba rivulosa]|uniref:Uncharacterized protein n=1 Tax=Obba rivulosa TaxID=1052685 RepID=A0A8E2DVR7_9APHY|nr:hypothetical protein OBBRIDRAFT_787128 [Obba rivulosa]